MKRSAIAIIFNQNRNEVLLIKRRDVPVWVIPGGGVDTNESPENAAIREAHEETGLTVRITRQIAFYTPVNTLATDTYVYECIATEGDLTTGAETADIAYFPIDKLPTTLFFIHKEWLKDAIKNDPIVIQKTLSHITYSNLALYFLRHPLQVIRYALSRFGMPINKKDQ